MGQMACWRENEWIVGEGCVEERLEDLGQGQRGCGGIALCEVAIAELPVSVDSPTL